MRQTELAAPKSDSPFAWFALCVQRTFEVKGRSRRSELFWFLLPCQLVLILITGLDTIPPDVERYSREIWCALMLVPAITASIRRLHDSNRSGWHVAVVLVPVIGLFVLLWWLLESGTRGSNRFGADLKTESMEFLLS